MCELHFTQHSSVPELGEPFNEILVRLGDAAWREALSAHYEGARRELERFRGQEVETTGDGLLATFLGPAAAVRCAEAIRSIAAREGLSVRAGLHVGEIEHVGNGIAVPQ